MIYRSVIVTLCLFCAAAEEAGTSAADAMAEGEDDETKAMLKDLTISMVSEVVDERTFMVRDAGAKVGKKKLYVRLGNVAPPVKGAAHTDEEHQGKLDTARESMTKLLGKQMIWWKAADDEHQKHGEEAGASEDTPLLADVWLIDGRHVNGLLKKEGHVIHVEEYSSDMARNILTAEADEKKKESYKELEQAMKESDKFRKQAAAEAKKAAEKEAIANEPSEPIGVAGWIGIVTFCIIGVGVATNFGKESKKGKVNYNRKKGPLERFWSKLKGA